MGEHERGTVADRLARIERTLARIETRLDKALGTEATPVAITDERGRFSPGSGWITTTDEEPPAHYQPRATEQTAYAALTAMRANLHPEADT